MNKADIMIHLGSTDRPIIVKVEPYNGGYVPQCSWGSWVSSKGFERLLNEDGEAVIMQEKRLLPV